jgi:hypothetical protein
MPKILGVHTSLVDSKDKWQVKVLASNFAANGVITGLTYSNLVVGKTYGIILTVNRLGTSSSFLLTCDNGSQVVFRSDTRPASTDLNGIEGVSVFTATATTLTFTMSSFDSGETIVGNGTRNGTFAILIEEPNIEPTTIYT